jgi:hypothetical protein
MKSEGLRIVDNKGKTNHYEIWDFMTTHGSIWEGTIDTGYMNSSCATTFVCELSASRYTG